MARLTPIAPLPFLPQARNVHCLPKRSSFPISVLVFLRALPSMTSHPVKNDLQVFHLLKPLSPASSTYREKMDSIMNPSPAAKPITKGTHLTLPFLSLPTAQSSSWWNKSSVTWLEHHNQLGVQGQATPTSSVPTTLLGNFPEILLALSGLFTLELCLPRSRSIELIWVVLCTSTKVQRQKWSS